MSSPALERIGEILERRNRDRAELEARIGAACCPETGLPGESGVTLVEHVERIADTVEHAKRTTAPPTPKRRNRE